MSLLWIVAAVAAKRPAKCVRCGAAPAPYLTAYGGAACAAHKGSA